MERCITSIVPPLRLPIPRVYIYIAFISYSRFIHPRASPRSHLAAFEKEGAFEEREREKETVTRETCAAQLSGRLRSPFLTIVCLLLRVTNNRAREREGGKK